MPTSLDSFRRLRRAKNFAPRFYENLLASNKAIRERFAETNFTKQHELFDHGLHVLLEYAAGSAIGEMAIRRLGQRHGPGDLNINPLHYDIWIESLVKTARELDPKWNFALEKRMRKDLRLGIDEMVRAYHALPS